MDEIAKIVADITAGNLKPIYFLMGEEPYYIDRLSGFIEKNVLQDHEKDFNQTILYGRDVSVEDIVSAAKRFPMMSEKQVIIVKEAQELAKTIENIEKYAENPMPTTVLVFCYKYKTLDKRKKALKTIQKNGLVFESKKLYENQVGQWINRVLQAKDYKIEPKANAMLVEFLGTDLSKINNELEKLQVVLPKGSTITAKDIEVNIGFSKDFNVFELRNAIGVRNQKKAYQIVQYFADNPKDNNIVMVVGLVFSFFTQLLKYHALKDKNPANVAKTIGVSPFFLKDYDVAIKNYQLKQVSAAIHHLREIDLKSKGVGAANLSLSDLYKEMLVKVFS
jgi:DNA polymerase III subunit delta